MNDFPLDALRCGLLTDGDHTRIEDVAVTWSRWRELPGAWASAVSRPRWQLVVAFPISVWVLVWVGAQFNTTGAVFTPLDVPRAVLSRFGQGAAGWLDVVGGWLRDPAHAGLLTATAWAAGLLWAATTERTLLPALAGWLLVMAAAEGLGYQPAISRAVLVLAGFIALLALCALPNRGKLVDRRARLLPVDVLTAGAVAAALSGMVPLLAPGLAVTRLLRPYLTKPARPDPSRPVIPAARPPVEAITPPKVPHAGEMRSPSRNESTVADVSE
ncbi:hypothetical protein M8C13_18485 [Crossiella sp. SN42]|uniref:hypothetical protein n=1 Tax=Crossiella sp. SN42 TaxID=2944808 RepID=UPI00207CDAA5|nr:hypothetical protein [Crossiella sp. SN42]MCO1577747.1 hypothetical protein [Crossiella sp. SN42]